MTVADLAARSAGAGQPTGRPLDVLHVGMGWLPWHGGGGVERYVYGLVAALPAVGARPACLVQGSRPAGGTAGREDACRVESAAADGASLAARVLGVRRAVGRAVAAGPVDLIASHFALYGSAATAGRRVPHVVHFHGPWAAESAVEGGGRLSVATKAAVERTTYRRAARLLTVSRAFADLLARDYGVAGDRVRTVGAGVELDRFDVLADRRQARERLGWPADRPIVLAVRRLARRMGLENLVDAAKTLAAGVPDVLVMIAGRGPMLGELGRAVAASGVGRNVRLLGYLPEADLPLAYRAADLTVVPSVALEGFGLSAAESLAAGTPAVVTPVGGLPEVVSGLSPELVCDGSSAAAVADRLAACLTGRVPVPKPEHCRQFAADRFDWRDVAARVRAAYDEALG